MVTSSTKPSNTKNSNTNNQHSGAIPLSGVVDDTTKILSSLSLGHNPVEENNYDKEHVLKSDLTLQSKTSKRIHFSEGVVLCDTRVGVDATVTVPCEQYKQESKDYGPGAVFRHWFHRSDFNESVDIRGKKPRSFERNQNANPLCERSELLTKSCRKLIGLVRRVIGVDPISRDPPLVSCGELRNTVKSMFPSATYADELSIKTIAKLERDCCDACAPRFQGAVSVWRNLRYPVVDISTSHIERFRSVAMRNVERGWDDERSPFIPNGNATLFHQRKQGGNWNVEPFDDRCRSSLVFSSGKPRVVTLYSSYNTRVLAPLHYSLYGKMKKRGWLLVGDPTSKHIRALKGGDYLSFDYSSATDNLKTDYVNVLIDVLIEKASCLSDEEKKCLRVLGRYKIDDDDRYVTRGQPMGSIMSFPLLCLFNKIVVDLALDDQLDRKHISHKTWVNHECLINGDDLLIRDVGVGLSDGINFHSSNVGFCVNFDKTLRSPTHAEINSTLFINGLKVRKTNFSSIHMKSDVNDVLSFAAASTTSPRLFKIIVRANAHILSKQKDKHLSVQPEWVKAICRKTTFIRKAICSGPDRERPIPWNCFHMEEKHADYNVPRDEEYQLINQAVDRVRDSVLNRPRARPFRCSIVRDIESYHYWLTKPRKPVERELTFSFLARRDIERKRALIVERYGTQSSDSIDLHSCRKEVVNQHGEAMLDPNDSPVNRMIRLLRLHKQEKGSVSLVSSQDDMFDSAFRCYDAHERMIDGYEPFAQPHRGS